jgi:DNA-binding MarR family transcriptional regulator
MRFIAVWEVFRNIYRDVSASTVGIFFRIAIAGDEGVPLRDLERNGGMTQSAISRHVQLLSERTWRCPGQPRGAGLGLVEAREDPLDARRRIAFLNEQGVQLWQKIQKLIGS